MKRDEIYWGRLDPIEGSEMGKTRLAHKIGVLPPADAAALRALLTEMYGEA